MRTAHFILILASTLCALKARTDEPQSNVKGTRVTSLSLGTGWGTTSFGGKKSRDVLLASFGYGWVVSRRFLPDSPLAGHLIAQGETIILHQYHPDTAFLAGIGPALRYQMGEPRKGWRPFVEAGVAFAVTDMGKPDLGGRFQFYDYAGCGIHVGLTQRAYLVMRYRFSHISNAGIRHPNRGVNDHNLLTGLGFRF